MRAHVLVLLLALCLLRGGAFRTIGARAKKPLLRMESDSIDEASSTEKSSVLNSSKEQRMMTFPFNFLPSSPYLTGELAGDIGFDPLGIVKSRNDLFVLREAEIKHARLALLGSLGWPIGELYHSIIAERLGLENLLQNGRTPSVLNGGLNNIYVLGTLGTFFAVGALLELELIKKKKEIEGPEELKNFFQMFNEDGYDVPGNYQFDPLSLGTFLCGNDRNKRKSIQTMEIFNGRLAMLATVGYVVQEFVTGVPLIRETPAFFGL